MRVVQIREVENSTGPELETARTLALRLRRRQLYRSVHIHACVSVCWDLRVRSCIFIRICIHAHVCMRVFLSCRYVVTRFLSVPQVY